MIRLFGGIEGVPERLRSGEILAQYVVLGDPREVHMGELRRAVEGKLNRERRALKLAPAEGWSLSVRWSYPPRLTDEAQVIEAGIWGVRGETLGVCRLVWPTAEMMGSEA